MHNADLRRRRSSIFDDVGDVVAPIGEPLNLHQNGIALILMGEQGELLIPHRMALRLVGVLDLIGTIIAETLRQWKPIEFSVTQTPCESLPHFRPVVFCSVDGLGYASKQST